MAHVRLERRPGDFGDSGPVTGYSGACCCCCCLHMVGAAIGGPAGIALALALERRRRTRPLHRRAWRWLLGGFAAGVAFDVALITAATLFPESSITYEVVLGLAVFVPSLLFVPPGAGMMLGARWLKRRSMLQGEAAAESTVYCPRCRYDLRGSGRSDRCPECGAAIPWSKLKPGIDYGQRCAWRVAWVSVLLASLLMGVGWLIMFPMIN